MGTYYQEKLKELQNTFCEGASNLLTIHINHIIKNMEIGINILVRLKSI